jgi:bifunctional DNA-binding transcriptional regulator/antitoxin component of YhaV-PrlF toxin-antitoxin module
MAPVSYIAKVLRNGHLSLSKKAREELRLEAGQEVEIVVRTRGHAERLPEEAFAPLREIIVLAKRGKPDGAANHDKYLYGKKQD